jgi:beta-galactosidase
VILDLLGPARPLVTALERPILNELRPELDFARTRRPAVTLHLDSAKPAHVGMFAPGTSMQEIRFSAPVTGNYFCLESLNAHDGKAFAAVAELTLLDLAGQPLPGESTTVIHVDSEERAKEDGSAENAIDGQTANFWHTQWSDSSPNHPHRLILDLGGSRAVGGFRYVPRQGAAGVGGRIKDYRVYVSDSLVRRKASAD